MTTNTTPFSRIKKLEIHMLRATPPNQSNSGQNAMNKTITFAGVTRDRLSSQSIKKPMRNAFDTPRTKQPQEVIRKYLSPEALASEAVNAILLDVTQNYYGKFDKKGRNQLPSMIAIGKDEAERIANLINQNFAALQAAYVPGVFADTDDSPEETEDADTAPEEPAKGAKVKPKAPKLSASDKEKRQAYLAALTELTTQHKPGSNSNDLALFGRFIANLSDEMIDGAVYMSHAVGTHRSRLAEEIDFFSAFDDVSGTTEHIGERGLVAPLYYYCVVLDVEQYRANRRKHQPDISEQDIETGVRNFVREFAFAHPTGGSHGAFAHTLPEYILAVGRSEGYGINLANAYTDPVYPTRGVNQNAYRSTLDISIQRLLNQLRYNQTAFGKDNGLIGAAHVTSQIIAEHDQIELVDHVGSLDSALDIAFGI